MVEKLEPLWEDVDDLNLNTEVVWVFIDLHNTESFVTDGLLPLNESNLGSTDKPFLVQAGTAWSNPEQSTWDQWGLNQNYQDGYKGFVLDTQNVEAYYRYSFAYELVGNDGPVEPYQQALIDVLLGLDQ